MEAVDASPLEDPSGLDAIVVGIIETRARIAGLQAEEVRLLHAAREHALARTEAPSLDADAPCDVVLRSVAAEIGAATAQSDRTVQARMEDAATLMEGYPSTWKALQAGRISRAHAGVIADAGAVLPDAEARTRYEDAVLPVAERETAGRLRPVARRLAQQTHPVPVEERHRAAARSRRVWVTDLDDGLAELGLRGPAHLIRGVHDRLTRLAHTVIDARRTPAPAGGSVGVCGSLTGPHAADEALAGLDTPAESDRRTLDEIRADVATDLLLTGHATASDSATSIPGEDAVRAHLQVTIPAHALVQATDQPADLAGHGPLDAHTARRLAAIAPGWDRLFTHPTTGAVLAVDRYRPTPEQRRLLHARDEHCRFPGCRQPASRSDLDHTIAHAHDGPTEITNLAHLCRRHHTLKHHSAWRVRQRPDGILQWTSPTGRVYDDHPARTLVFEPPPPF